MNVNRRNISMVVVLGLALTALACPALAQEKIDKSVSLNSDGSVSIINVNGTILVTGWDRDKVEIRGTLGEGTDRLEVDGDKDRLEIRVVIPEHARHVGDTHLDIKVPKECRLDVSGVSADIDVSKCEGKLDVQSVSGDVRVVGKMERLEAESVSGDVYLEADCADVTATSVSGDVGVVGSRGDLRVETVSGDCNMSGGAFTFIHANTVSGELSFEGEFTGDGSFSFDAHSGDVILALTKKPDAEFEVSTFSGDIENDFGSRGERISKYAPGKELTFTLGSGDAKVKIESFSGDIEIKKK